MATVFVVQAPARRQGGTWLKADLSPAQEWGEVVELIPPGNIRDEWMEDALLMMQNQLLNVDTLNDYLVPAGDPVATVMATGVFMQHAISQQGSPCFINVLKWDKFAERYDLMTIPI